jgi:phosphate transport system substrate-binding protein
MTLTNKPLSVNMRTSAFLILFVASVLQLNAQSTSISGTVKLRGTRLTYPLINQWIGEFNKEFPAIKVKIAQNAPADSIDLQVAAHSIMDEDLKGNKTYIAISRYVQLPIVNEQNPELRTLQASGFRDEDFNRIYFAKANAPEKKELAITVYNRERPTCSTITFARHFGNDANNINGTGVKGDDQDLLNAVKNDVNGISFNNLGFIYNVATRKINPGIAIVPLDLNENKKIDADERIYESLDNVISFVERTNNKKFIDEHVNVIFSKGIENKPAGIFLQWILTKGQKFNHSKGFLDLSSQILEEQKVIVNSTFRLSSISSCEGLNETLGKRKQKQKLLAKQ